MKQKVLIFLSLFVLVCTGAWGDNAAKIGETEYETLQVAIDAATAEDVVTVLVTQTTAPVLGSGKTVKINWNGTTVKTPTTVGAYYVASSSATVEEVKIYTYISKEAGASITKPDGTITYQSSLYASLITSTKIPTGSTVRLLKDETTSTRINFGSSVIRNRTITIDLGGHTYTNTGVNNTYASFFVGYGNNVTVKNGVMNLTDGICLNAATLTIDADATINGTATDNSSPSVLVYKKGTLNIKGTVTADKSAALQTHGSDTEENTIVINAGATVTSTNNNAIYFPANGTITINGTVSGQSGIEMKGGALTVGSTASIKATATETTHNVNKSGSSTSGYAIAVVESSTYQGSIIATVVEGATVIGPVAKVVDSEVDDTKKSVISITGGNFSSDPNKYCAEGYYALKADGAQYYVVEKIQPVEIEVPALTNENVTPEGESAPTQEQANAAVTTFVQNEAVTSFEITPASESLKEDGASSGTSETVTIGGEAVSVSGKTLVDLMKLVAAQNGVSEDGKNNIEASDISQYMKIVFKKASVNNEGSNAVVGKIAFDVKPTAVAVVENKKLELPVPNALIAAPIAFRLPVDKNTIKQFVELYHKDDGSSTEDQLGLYEIKTAVNGDKYIDVSASLYSEYGYALSGTTGTLTVYKGNSTKCEDVAVADWTSIQAETPNAIAIVASDLASWANAQSNVLVEYSFGSSGGKVYECPKLVLTDLKDFYTPVGFTALTGSYSRQPNAKENSDIKYNSVCLPFALTGSSLSSTAKILTFSYYADNTVCFNKVDQINAGTPCIIYEEGTSWNAIAFDKTEVVASPTNDGNMKGTFVNTTAYGKNGGSTTDYYSVNSEGKFQTLAANLSPFRSCLYIHCDETIEQGSDAKRIVIIGDNDEATGINEIVETNASEKAGIYNFNGIKVGNSLNGLSRGIYIQNGKKIIVK